MKIGNPEEQVRLRELANKIRALLKEYDVAGIVNIQGKDQAEFVNEITPSWSCLSLEKRSDGAFGVRFKAKMKTGDEAEKEAARQTVGMVLGFCQIMSDQSEMMGQIRSLIGQHLEIENIIIKQRE